MTVRTSRNHKHFCDKYLHCEDVAVYTEYLPTLSCGEAEPVTRFPTKETRPRIPLKMDREMYLKRPTPEDVP